jgi:hypothetical protein
MAFRLLTRTFLESTAETTIGWGASGAGAILVLHAADLLTDVPWYAVLSGAGIGALGGFCKALSSLKVQPDNGNSSYLRRVVAADGTHNA